MAGERLEIDVNNYNERLQECLKTLEVLTHCVEKHNNKKLNDDVGEIKTSLKSALNHKVCDSAV